MNIVKALFLIVTLFVTNSYGQGYKEIFNKEIECTEAYHRGEVSLSDFLLQKEENYIYVNTKNIDILNISTFPYVNILNNKGDSCRSYIIGCDSSRFSINIFFQSIPISVTNSNNKSSFLLLTKYSEYNIDKTINKDRGGVYSLIKNTDCTRLYEISKEGKVLKEKVMAPDILSIEKVEDGYFLLSRTYVIKVDNNFNRKWKTKIYSKTEKKIKRNQLYDWNKELYNMIKPESTLLVSLQDGGVLVVKNQIEFKENRVKPLTSEVGAMIHFYKLDCKGKLKSYYKYSLEQFGSILSSVEQTKNDGVIIGYYQYAWWSRGLQRGEINPIDKYNEAIESKSCDVMLFSSNGKNLIWKKDFASGPGGIRTIQVINDSTFFIGGYVYESSLDGMIIKINILGEEIWRKIIVPGHTSIIDSIIRLNDNEYLISDGLELIKFKDE
jgi:hypothetical protein